MRCRQCGAHFELLDTIFWTGPPGPPITPRQALLTSLALMLGAGGVIAIYWLFVSGPPSDPRQAPPFLFIVACVVFFAGLCLLAYWPLNYLGWRLDARSTQRWNPLETHNAPGKCPRCSHWNPIRPWSG